MYLSTYIFKMPEGPEVYITANQLHTLLQDTWLLSIQSLDKTFSKYTPIPEEFLPCKIVKIFPRGKNIFFCLLPVGQNAYIFLHNKLGMTGVWLQEPNNYPRFKFDIYHQDTYSRSYIYYCDLRKFGRLDFLTLENFSNLYTSLYPDLIQDNIPSEDWLYLCRKSKKNICSFLMESNGHVYGIGNYAKAEILYRCAISPWVRICDLSDDQLNKLLQVSQSFLRLSCEQGGVTLSDYKHINGQEGKCVLYVYNKYMDPQGNRVKIDKTPDNRNTYWVPEIQK